MAQLKKHFIGILFLTVLIIGFIGSKASKPIPKKPKVYITGTIKLNQKENDIFTKPSLSKILSTKENLSIVLRVPAPPKNVTQEEKNNVFYIRLKEQQERNNSIYNTIEKEFSKANFIVRDRALFNKVLDNEASDYSKINELTDTDLILELVRYKNVTYNTNTYIDEEGSEQTISNNFSLTGTMAEFKIIDVKKNDLVGVYTFNYTPCVKGCKYRFSPPSSKLYPLSTAGDSHIKSYEFVTQDVLENFFKESSLHLIKELRGK